MNLILLYIKLKVTSVLNLLYFFHSFCEAFPCLRKPFQMVDSKANADIQSVKLKRMQINLIFEKDFDPSVRRRDGLLEPIMSPF